MGGPSGSKKPAAAKPKAPEGTPELHAATGGESTLPEGKEPSLPSQPLEIRPNVAEQIGSSRDPDTLELGAHEPPLRLVYPPFYQETRGRYRLRTVFPLWVERTKPSLTQPAVVDRASVFGGIYYQRRSAERADDVLFPLFWNWRDRQKASRTTILGPLVNRVAPGERDDWLLPLYATGKRKDGGYIILPPLLTYTRSTAEGGFNLIGPAFCSWKGGPHCDARTANDLDYGVAPFFLAGQDEKTRYQIITPLLHYYRYTEKDQSYTDLWGLYYRRHEKRSVDGKLRDWDKLHLLPLYYSLWGPGERHTTVLPFFHYGYAEDSWLFINPLFLAARGQQGERTFVTWGYARYRGRTELDMITPLYWDYRDPDAGLHQRLLFPFLYSRTSPRESSHAFFPFWGHFHRFAISESTWITPFFQHTTDLRGWSTNFHPLLYLGRDGNRSHTVVAPVFFDFAGPSSRSTVGFPVYWRFADQDTVSQLVGNVYYQQKRLKDGLDWQVHIFPAFSYGETPDGHWWNVLFGLAGYTRRGSTTTLRALWIPIELSGEQTPRRAP
jgi:hypothetical protein